LFVSLLWASLGQDLEAAYEAQYYQHHIRKRAAELLGMQEDTATILNFERFRNDLVFPQRASHVPQFLGFAATVTARYGPFVIPIAISLGGATVIYFDSFGLPPVDVIGWTNLALLATNLVYAISTVPYALHVAHAYRAETPVARTARPKRQG